MGVYLSEITMPKGEGSKLVLQIFPSGEVYDEHGIRLGITNWAEAIPVPPHGRLGDLDELELAFNESAEGLHGTPKWAEIYRECAKSVREATTIIPADPEKEET